LIVPQASETYLKTQDGTAAYTPYQAEIAQGRFEAIYQLLWTNRNGNCQCVFLLDESTATAETYFIV
jgi:glycine cleavage system pyridoxal-binding protein P